MAAQTGQKVFGAGRFYGIPTSANPTPSPFGVTQDMTLDFKRDVKRLFGQNQLPVDVASGMLSVTGKVTHAVVNARLINDLMIGGSLTTGQIPNVANETVTVTGTTLGAGGFTVANGAGYVLDLGLYATLTGVPLVRVSTSATPSSGQYSVDTTSGVYVTSSLDGNISMKASYLYSTVGGQNVSMTNQPMGTVGGFQAVMAWLWGTEKATIQLNKCVASDLGYGTKLDDYMKPTFGFEAATDTTDTLGTLSVAEVN